MKHKFKFYVNSNIKNTYTDNQQVKIYIFDLLKYLQSQFIFEVY